MEEVLDPTKWKEGKVIINFLLARWHKGLANLVAVIGNPGTGKSYVCMRIGELVSTETKAPFTIQNVFSIADDNELKRFIKFLRNAERGSVMILEEASVLFNSRRFMSKLNVNFNKILDTVRKKGILLVINYPQFKTTDMHIERMVNILIETRVVYKSYNTCIVKPMILQTDVQTGKTYRHKLLENGEKIDYTVLLKPKEELCKQYEAGKDKYLDDLYNTLEEKGKKEKITIVKDLKRLQLTEKQLLVLNYSNSGLEVKDIYKKMGVSQERVYKILRDAKKKQALLKTMEKMARDKEIIN